MPAGVDEETIRRFVSERQEWIDRCREKFARQEAAPRRYVTGETHCLLGQPLLLGVFSGQGTTGIDMDGQGNILMHVPAGHDAACRERMLYEWYRCRLKAEIPALLEKWERVVGVRTAEWGVKRMKTKWGTCNIRARRVWLNLELARKPLACLEYIIVHELTHLLERGHNRRFYELLDRFMPAWRQHREELNRTWP